MYQIKAPKYITACHSYNCGQFSFDLKNMFTSLELNKNISVSSMLKKTYKDTPLVIKRNVALSRDKMQKAILCIFLMNF